MVRLSETRFGRLVCEHGVEILGVHEPDRYGESARPGCVFRTDHKGLFGKGSAYAVRVCVMSNVCATDTLSWQHSEEAQEKFSAAQKKGSDALAAWEEQQNEVCLL